MKGRVSANRGFLNPSGSRVGDVSSDVVGSGNQAVKTKSDAPMPQFLGSSWSACSSAAYVQLSGLTREDSCPRTEDKRVTARAGGSVCIVWVCLAEVPAQQKSRRYNVDSEGLIGTGWMREADA
jgi:hypothetical protein